MKRPPITTSLSLNLAPMVDVIMCLLIFFMLATKMVEQEDSRIDLPLARAAKDVEKQKLGNRLVVNIRGNGQSKETVTYLIREEPVPLADVLRRLQIEGNRDSRVNCVIRADKAVPYHTVEAIMIGCAKANISNVTFSAIQGESATQGKGGTAL